MAIFAMIIATEHFCLRAISDTLRTMNSNNAATGFRLRNITSIRKRNIPLALLLLLELLRALSFSVFSFFGLLFGTFLHASEANATNMRKVNKKSRKITVRSPLQQHKGHQGYLGKW